MVCLQPLLLFFHFSDLNFNLNPPVNSYTLKNLLYDVKSVEIANVYAPEVPCENFQSLVIVRRATETEKTDWLVCGMTRA